MKGLQTIYVKKKEQLQKCRQLKSKKDYQINLKGAKGEMSLRKAQGQTQPGSSGQNLELI